MFLIISLIISLLEMKNIIKDKKIKLLIFFVIIIFISVFLYVKRDDIDSLKIIIDKIKGYINGKS